MNLVMMIVKYIAMKELPVILVVLSPRFKTKQMMIMVILIQKLCGYILSWTKVVIHTDLEDIMDLISTDQDDSYPFPSVRFALLYLPMVTVSE